MVAEADESDAQLPRAAPEVAVVTNVELDHHSRWSSRRSCSTRSRASPSPRRGSRSGPTRSSTRSRDAPRERRVLRFDAERPGPPLELRGPGPPQRAQRARGAGRRSSSPGLDPVPAAAALASFPGMLRRQQRKGERAGAEIYDDYAHHPTEVAATLEAMRELRPRRLIAVFQPHLYSRTKALARRFGAALAAADEVGVLDVYPAREQPVGELAGVSGLDGRPSGRRPRRRPPGPLAARLATAERVARRRGWARATCW